MGHGSRNVLAPRLGIAGGAGRGLTLGGALLALALGAGCAGDGGDEELEVLGNSKVSVTGADGGRAAADGATAGAMAPIPTEPDKLAKDGGPLLGAVKMAVSIYERPDHRSNKLGYLRVGTKVFRAEKPAAFDSCQGGFYSILPHGFVCLDDGATIDMEDPLMRADIHQGNHDKPLPYTYAFVRAIAPRYYRLPTKKEQFQYEMSLKRHLRSWNRLKNKWNRIQVGSNDVRMLPEGIVLGPPPAEPPELNHLQRMGGDGSGTVPWFFDGGRQIPNISSFKVPDYAVITNRIKRHAGVALIDAFSGDERDFALTTDLRLIPISKLKPARGSTFHGVELGEAWELPMGFVKRPEGAYPRDRRKGRFKRIKKRLAYGTPIQLTGESKRDGKYRYVETDEGIWIRSKDLAIAPLVSKLPSVSRKGEKWIDVGLFSQTLVAYEGTEPKYVTMVSTGKDGVGDPGKTHSTPQGTFRIRDKHVTNTMDSQTVGEEFELMDVPWVQYFKGGYAIHAAYWHTEFGKPRSHGCINLSPIDAYRIFRFTEPHLPSRWHGVNAAETTGEGTIVHIHK